MHAMVCILTSLFLRDGALCRMQWLQLAGRSEKSLWRSAPLLCCFLWVENGFENFEPGLCDFV